MTPAEILLLITMVIAVAVALLLILLMVKGEKTLNVWGSEQPVKLIEWFLYATTGIWLIKWTMVLSMTISHKAPYIGAGICVFILLLLVVFYVLDITVLNTKELFTTTLN